jgi:formiminoglutamase
VHISQIGIQSFANSQVYAEVARNAGIEVISIDEVRERGVVNVVSGALSRLATIARKIYVDLDVDVLDRGFAPGSPGSRPGGLLPFELLAAARCCGAHPQVAAIDIVEVDPSKDVADTTVLAAASCLMSFAAGYHARLSI